MWEAYYAHAFLRLLGLLLALFKEQFRVNNVVAVQLAYHSTRAAMLFRKTNNTAGIKRHLEKYYRLLVHHALESFDYRAAAESELAWWVIHRYPSRGSLAQALAANMSILYSVPPERLQKYATEKAKAMELRDTATHTYKQEPDWMAIGTHLQRSYRALLTAVTSS